jgi:hypothetical protein
MLLVGAGFIPALRPGRQPLETYRWKWGWFETNTESSGEQPSFDNPAIFIYSYSNQPGHPNQQS